MARSRRLRSIVGWVVVLGFVVGAGAPKPTPTTDTALPAWNGGVDLYRAGTFTTQKSWLWCTAAGVQIVDNIVEHRKDHTTAGQRRYFDWMRKHNRYSLPVSAGVDPAGWTAGLRHFVDGRYRLVASRTFDDALRSAVTNLRKTNLPVAITVSHGGHGWILTGFRATADPAVTDSFKVTSVRVVGPLYGLQSKNGYDMPPNTRLTTAQLRMFFTPWKYAPKPMIWDGRYVSIQPIPVKAPAKASTPTPTPTATALVTVLPSTSPSAVPAQTAAASLTALAAVIPDPTPVPTPVAEAILATSPADETASAVWVVVAVASAGLVAAIAASVGWRRRRHHGKA